MKQNLLLILAATLALVAGIYVKNNFAVSETQTQTVEKLNFSLLDLTGKTHNISEWYGKILIINFWATWCPPCLKEIPEFIKLQQEFSDQNVQFIGIAIEDQPAVSKYLSTLKINYPVLIGGDEAITLSQQLGNIVNAVPFTVIVNQQGQIIHRQPGELSRTKILELLAPLI